jgi:siroheme synthase (precorrin-2 oxidase/ferrochelatase)
MTSAAPSFGAVVISLEFLENNRQNSFSQTSVTAFVQIATEDSWSSEESLRSRAELEELNKPVSIMDAMNCFFGANVNGDDISVAVTARASAAITGDGWRPTIGASLHGFTAFDANSMDFSTASLDLYLDGLYPGELPQMASTLGLRPYRDPYYSTRRWQGGILTRVSMVEKATAWHGNPNSIPSLRTASKTPARTQRQVTTVSVSGS